MTFQEAEKQLLRIAAGRYCTLNFSKTIPHAGADADECMTECYLYVDYRKSGVGQTWADAFMELEKDLGINIQKVEETPEVDDGEIDEVDLAKQVCGMEVK